MIFQHSLDIPASTTVDEPLRENMKVVQGLVYKLDIMFPPGCSGLAHLAINYGLHRLWPMDELEYFSSDSNTIAYDETYELKEEPPILNIIGWNDDTFWAHKITVRLGIVAKVEYMARYLPHLAYILIKEAEEEEKRKQKQEALPSIYLPFKSG